MAPDAIGIIAAEVLAAACILLLGLVLTLVSGRDTPQPRAAMSVNEASAEADRIVAEILAAARPLAAVEDPDLIPYADPPTRAPRNFRTPMYGWPPDDRA